MRLSKHFGKTLHNPPSDAILVSHQLILRSAMARPLSNGIWAYLPLGQRTLRRIESTLQTSMDNLEAEEIKLPIIQWNDEINISSRNHLTISTGYEKIAALLAFQEINSHRDLPRIVYQTQSMGKKRELTKHGLLGLLVFHSFDVFSFHQDGPQLDETYQAVSMLWRQLFERLGLSGRWVAASSSHATGNNEAHTYMLPHTEGKTGFVHCSSCDYAAAFEVASFERQTAQYGEPDELEKVETPDCHTIAALSEFLGIDSKQTLKLVIYTINFNQPDEAVVMVLLRGDLDVSEEKLMRILDVEQLDPTSEDMIIEIGAVAGYASPIGVKIRENRNDEGVFVIADDSLKAMTNFVTGANDAEYHYINANYPRDFQVTEFADIARPYTGARCHECDSNLQLEQAIALAHITKTGTSSTREVDATFQDETGKEQPVVMGSYQIELDRLLAAIIEENHDDYGIIWPREAAPFDVHLVAIGKKIDDDAVQIAEQLYTDLKTAEISVAYDDRLLSPGNMFSDADLMGIPLRLTVGARSLEKGGVEVKWRYQKDREIVPLDGIVEAVTAMLAED